jgi:hypothetical protein
MFKPAVRLSPRKTTSGPEVVAFVDELVARGAVRAEPESEARRQAVGRRTTATAASAHSLEGHRGLISLVIR